MRRLHVVRFLRVVAVAAALLVSPAVADAHSGTYDMKYVDGSNLVLVTFNTHQPVSGLAIRHNLRLYDLVGAPIPYDKATVEVHTRGKDAGITLRGHSLLEEQTLPLDPTNDSTLTYSYPRAGAYTLLVRFWAGGRPISHGEFAVDVGQGASTRSLAGLRLPQTLAAFVGGLVAYHLLSRRRPRTDSSADADQSPRDRHRDAGGDVSADAPADGRASVDGSHVPA